MSAKKGFGCLKWVLIGILLIVLMGGAFFVASAFFSGGGIDLSGLPLPIIGGEAHAGYRPGQPSAPGVGKTFGAQVGETTGGVRRQVGEALDPLVKGSTIQKGAEVNVPFSERVQPGGLEFGELPGIVFGAGFPLILAILLILVPIIVVIWFVKWLGRKSGVTRLLFGDTATGKDGLFTGDIWTKIVRGVGAIMVGASILAVGLGKGLLPTAQTEFEQWAAALMVGAAAVFVAILLLNLWEIISLPLNSLKKIANMLSVSEVGLGDVFDPILRVVILFPFLTILIGALGNVFKPEWVNPTIWQSLFGFISATKWPVIPKLADFEMIAVDVGYSATFSYDYRLVAAVLGAIALIRDTRVAQLLAVTRRSPAMGGGG